MTDAPPSAAQTSAFLGRWRAAGGTERANYQLFVGKLCTLLECPTPDPAREDTRDNAYVFERCVQFAHGDGSTSHGFIDCYRRGGFVLEAKKVKAPGHASTTRCCAPARCPPPSSKKGGRSPSKPSQPLSPAVARGSAASRRSSKRWKRRAGRGGGVKRLWTAR